MVCLQQLKGMLGLQHFTTATDLVSVVKSVFSQVHQVQYSLSLRPTPLVINGNRTIPVQFIFILLNSKDLCIIHTFH